MTSFQGPLLPRWFGSYVLLDLLAKGGMAEVYRAKVTGAEHFQRLVAIKCLRPELALDDEFTAMFIDEANVAAQLLHANIAQTYELGKCDEQLYIAMELVPGRDLRHVLRVAKKIGKRLPVGFCAYVVAKAAEGLDFAHRKHGMDGKPLGLVHRDVSPQNVMVSFHGEVKLLDFGIAKASVRISETRTGILKGNLAHMSPEQAAGVPADRRADIFGLGTILFELLAGRRLFVAEDELGMFEKVRTADISFVQAATLGFPPVFEPILHRCLAKNPEERFSWASDLVDALTPQLVESGRLFGAKHAAEVMESLFPEEIETEKQLLKRYADLALPPRAAVAERESETGLLSNEPLAASSPAASAGPSSSSSVAPSSLASAAPSAEVSAAPLAVPLAVPSPAPSPVMSAAPSAASSPVASAAQSPEPSCAVPRPNVAAVATPEAPGSTSDWRVPTCEVPVEVVRERIMALRAQLGQGVGESRRAPASDASVAIDTVVRRRPPSLATPAGGADAGSPVGAHAGEHASAPTTVAAQGRSEVTPKVKPQALLVSAVAVLVVIAAGALFFALRDKPATEPAPRPAAAEEEVSEASAPADESGFVTVRVTGARAFRIYIDGEEIGKAALTRLSVGKHAVKVVEMRGGKPGRAKTGDVTVTPQHTRNAPARVVVAF